MTAQEIDRLVQGVFGSIFGSVTQAEPGGKPLMTPSNTVLSLMKPGLAINPRDFRNPWTPGNNNGDKDAAINTARLVDSVIRANGIYEDTGKLISQVYDQILNGVTIPKQTPNPAIEKQLDDAWNFLNRIVDVTDPETGAVSKKTIESQVYRDYLDNQAAYMNARMAYVAAYTAAQEKPETRNTWPLIAPTLQIPVKQAWDRWRSNFADKVEQNLAIMTTSTQNALQKAFKKAQDTFEGYGVALEETGGLPVPIQRVSLLPSNWHSVNSDAKWITKKISAGEASSSSSSDYKSFGASAGFSLGIFSIGAKAGGKFESRQFSSQTQNLSFEFSSEKKQVKTGQNRSKQVKSS